mgnify:CR=1 FL=1
MGRAAKILGLDIGSHAIKAACVEHRRNGWRLLGVGAVPTPRDAVTAGMIQDHAAVAEAVESLIRQYRLPPAEAVAAVGGSSVSVRAVRIPEIPLPALRRSIRFEAAKFLPSVEDSAIEFAVLGRGGTPPQMEVLLVAAPQALVDSRVQVIRDVGLEPAAIDIEAFALLRVLEALHLLPGPNQGLAIANIGATFTDLNIVVESEVAVTRSIPIGGKSLTHAIMSQLNVTELEAEQLKSRIVLGRPTPPAAWAGVVTPSESVPEGTEEEESEPAVEEEWLPDEMLQSLRQAAQPLLDEIVRELRRSVNFFQSQTAEAGHTVAVEQLLLAGGTAHLPGIAEYMGDRLGMDVRILDPFAIRNFAADGVVTSAVRERASELAVAIGLALKECD